MRDLEALVAFVFLLAVCTACTCGEVVQLPLSLYKQKYYLSILVGTPGQTAKVVLDTGSSLLYIPQEECYWADGNKCRPPRFQPGASSTLQDLQHQSTSSYTGGYSVSFRAIRDILQVGDVKVETDMGLVTEYTTKSELDPPYSGLWGLAPKSAAIESLLNSGQLDRPIISLYFKPDPNAARSDSVVPEGAGYVTLGGWDPEFAAEDLQWVLLKPDQTSWTTSIRDVQLGDTQLDLCDNDCSFLTDTGGTSVLSMPDAHKQAVFAALGADENGKVPCDSISSLPELTFKVQDSATIRLPSSIYTTSSCRLRFQGGTEKTWVAGFGFMQYYFHLFDYGVSGSPQIGFARAASDA